MIRVSRQGNTVYAQIDGTAHDLLNTLIRRMGTGGMSADLMDAAKMPRKFVCTAKCHPDDEFIYEKGEEIAKERVLEKYHTYKAKAMDRVARVMMKQLEACNLFDIVDEEVGE